MSVLSPAPHDGAGLVDPDLGASDVPAFDPPANPTACPRLSRRFLTLACLLAAGSCHRRCHAAGPGLPGFRSAQQIETSCRQGLAGARERVKALEDSRVDASWLARLDDLSAYFEDAQGPVDLSQYVLPDKVLARCGPGVR